MSSIISKTFYTTTVLGSAILSVRMATHCYHDVVNTDNIFPKDTRKPFGILGGVIGGMSGAMIGGIIGATFPISFPIISSMYIRKKNKNRNL
jgi:hypothetical protein